MDKTPWLHTEALDWIETGDSRETNAEIMEAIAWLARNEAEADAIWEDGPQDHTQALVIWEPATKNGLLDGDDLMWGGRSFSQIMKEDGL